MEKKDLQNATNATNTDTLEAEAKKQREEQERTTIAKAAYLNAYEEHMGSQMLACKKIGINKSTVKRWRDSDNEFALALQRIDQDLYKDVEDREMMLIQQNDGPTIRHWLDRRHPLYKPNARLEVVDGVMTMEDILDKRARMKKALHEQSIRESNKSTTTTGAGSVDTGATGVHGLDRLHEGQPTVHPQQAGPDGTVRTESEPEVLPQQTDTPKSDTERPSAGTQ